MNTQARSGSISKLALGASDLSRHRWACGPGGGCTLRWRWRICVLAVLILTAVPRPLAAQEALPLSLKRAVELALSETGAARVQIAREAVEQARAGSARRRSALLPHIDAMVSEQNQTRNLEAIGLRAEGLFRPPTLVGPFTTFDARANLNQTIFDFSAIRRFQASRKSVEAAETLTERSEDETAALVSGLYLNAIRAKSSVEAAEADVTLAEQLLKQAIDRKNAGSGTRVEESRAGVQLSNEKQRLLAARFERRRTLLELKRAIGMDLTVRVELTDELTEKEPAVRNFDEALGTALQSRSDLRARRQAERSAELLYGAARLERLPSVSGFLNYGSIGAHPNDAIPTWAAGVFVRLPVFDGGRMEADRAEALSRLREERIKTSDLKRQIELEVRLALSGVELTRQQVDVARQGLDLARQELAQARRRYEAGFTSSIEVTDAQSRLERARENHIVALFNYNLARVNLSEAMGTVRTELQ